MKAKYQTFLSLCISALLFFNQGCAVVLLGGAAAGVGTVAFMRGELKSTQTIPFDLAWSATLATAEESGFLVIKEQKDAFSAVLMLRDAKNRKIQINLKKESESLTEIGIRVGVFGDQPISQTLLQKIKEKAVIDTAPEMVN